MSWLCYYLLRALNYVWCLLWITLVINSNGKIIRSHGFNKEFCIILITGIKYLPGKPGQKYPILSFENYCYKRIKKNKAGKVYWRCVMVHKGCSVYCIVGESMIEVHHEHNHPPTVHRTKTGRWLMSQEKAQVESEEGREYKK